MEKFYIITNDMKDANRKITVKIKKCIESYGKKCYLEEQPEEGNFSKIKIPKDIDCVLTVGGDGTFIQASRRLFGRELPMLGINMGTLGYLGPRLGGAECRRGCKTARRGQLYD